MSNKYGFGQEEPGEIVLPPPKPATPKPTPAEVAGAVEAGESLGFVTREPNSGAGRRRKKGEPQDKMFISGPARVIANFKDYADKQGLPYWQVIENLMKGGQK